MFKILVLLLLKGSATAAPNTGKHLVEDRSVKTVITVTAIDITTPVSPSAQLSVGTSSTVSAHILSNLVSTWPTYRTQSVPSVHESSIAESQASSLGSVRFTLVLPPSDSDVSVTLSKPPAPFSSTGNALGSFVPVTTSVTVPPALPPSSNGGLQHPLPTGFTWCSYSDTSYLLYLKGKASVGCPASWTGYSLTGAGPSTGVTVSRPAPSINIVNSSGPSPSSGVASSVEVSPPSSILLQPTMSKAVVSVIAPKSTSTPTNVVSEPVPTSLVVAATTNPPSAPLASTDISSDVPYHTLPSGYTYCAYGSSSRLYDTASGCACPATWTGWQSDRECTASATAGSTTPITGASTSGIPVTTISGSPIVSVPFSRTPPSSSTPLPSPTSPPAVTVPHSVPSGGWNASTARSMSTGMIPSRSSNLGTSMGIEIPQLSERPQALSSSQVQLLSTLSTIPTKNSGTTGHAPSNSVFPLPGFSERSHAPLPSSGLGFLSSALMSPASRPTSMVSSQPTQPSSTALLTFSTLISAEVPSADGESLFTWPKNTHIPSNMKRAVETGIPLAGNFDQDGNGEKGNFPSGTPTGSYLGPVVITNAFEAKATRRRKFGFGVE